MKKDSFTTSELDDQPIMEAYELALPYNDPVLDDFERLSGYVHNALKELIGDEADVGSIELKNPGLVHRSAAKLLKRTPNIKLKVTTKF